MSRGMGHVMRSLRALVEEFGWVYLANAAGLIYRGGHHEAVEKKHHVAVRRAANRLVAGGGFDLEEVRVDEPEPMECGGQSFTVQTFGLALIAGQSQFPRLSKFARVQKAAKELNISVATVYRDAYGSSRFEDGCLRNTEILRLPNGLAYQLVNTRDKAEDERKAAESSKAGGQRCT
jgi:hypothetical protein